MPLSCQEVLHKQCLDRRVSCPSNAKAAVNSNYSYDDHCNLYVDKRQSERNQSKTQFDQYNHPNGMDLFLESDLSLSSASCEELSDRKLNYYGTEYKSAHGVMEDQSTQTDDEADFETPKRRRRPTNLNFGTKNYE